MAEEGNKNIDLLNSEAELSMMSFHETNRMYEAAGYLSTNEQISLETSKEVRNLIQQRGDIIQEFQKKYDELSESVNSQGEAIRDDISEKGEEMKEKYDN